MCNLHCTRNSAAGNASNDKKKGKEIHVCAGMATGINFIDDENVFRVHGSPNISFASVERLNKSRIPKIAHAAMLDSNVILSLSYRNLIFPERSKRSWMGLSGWKKKLRTDFLSSVTPPPPYSCNSLHHSYGCRLQDSEEEYMYVRFCCVQNNEFATIYSAQWCQQWLKHRIIIIIVTHSCAGARWHRANGEENKINMHINCTIQAEASATAATAAPAADVANTF